MSEGLTQESTSEQMYSSDGVHVQLIQTARSFMLLLWCVMVLCNVMGCRHGKPDTQESTPIKDGVEEVQQEESDKPERSEQILFRAIIAECEARGYELATVSEQFFMVVTESEPVSAKLRKKRLIKIIVLPRGGALNVQVVYERDAGVGGQSEWKVVESESIRERASKEEMEIARAIEKRFHTMRR